MPEGLAEAARGWISVQPNLSAASKVAGATALGGDLVGRQEVAAAEIVQHRWHDAECVGLMGELASTRNPTGNSLRLRSPDAQRILAQRAENVAAFPTYSNQPQKLHNRMAAVCMWVFGSGGRRSLCKRHWQSVGY
jgi:hypothetical protein